MNKLHYLSVILLIGASLLYASVLVYFLDNGYSGNKLVNTYSSVVNTFDKNEVLELSDKQTYLQPIGLSFTEKRGVIGLIILSIFIFLLVPALILKERKARIYHTVQTPLIFLSALLILTFVSQSIRIGVF